MVLKRDCYGLMVEIFQVFALVYRDPFVPMRFSSPLKELFRDIVSDE